MNKINFSNFVICGSSSSGNLKFLAKDPMYSNWYWTESLNQAKIFNSIKGAQEVLSDSDFQHTREMIDVNSGKRSIHPPIAIDTMLELSKLNPENNGSIMIIKLEFTTIKSYSVKASRSCKMTENFLKLD